MKKKRLMVSKFGLHMASESLAMEDITKEAMTDVAKNFSRDADLNGGQAHSALTHFIYKLLAIRADREYDIQESGVEELSAGMSRLADELAARAFELIDAELNTFCDPQLGDQFEALMRMRGRHFLDEEAARKKMMQTLREKRRANNAAQSQTKKDTPAQE